MSGHIDHGRLVLVHAPMHAPTLTRAECARVLHDYGACVVNFTEAYARSLYLTTRLGWRPVMGRSEVDTRGVTSLRGDAGDNPILVRRAHRLEEGWAIQTTPPGLPLRLAPERWLHGAEIEHPISSDVIEDWNAHPNPVGPPSEGRGQRMISWNKTMTVLQNLLRKAQDAGHVVIGSGDLQVGRGVGTVLKILETELGLQTWSIGPDWIWWDPNRLRLLDTHVIHDNGQDHPWIRAEFDRAHS